MKKCELDLQVTDSEQEEPTHKSQYRWLCSSWLALGWSVSSHCVYTRECHHSSALQWGLCILYPQGVSPLSDLPHCLKGYHAPPGHICSCGIFSWNSWKQQQNYNLTPSGCVVTSPGTQTSVFSALLRKYTLFLQYVKHLLYVSCCIIYIICRYCYQIDISQLHDYIFNMKLCNFFSCISILIKHIHMHYQSPTNLL